MLLNQVTGLYLGKHFDDLGLIIYTVFDCTAGSNPEPIGDPIYGYDKAIQCLEGLRFVRKIQFMVNGKGVI